jgi:hypothetical protein
MERQFGDCGPIQKLLGRNLDAEASPKAQSNVGRGD